MLLTATVGFVKAQEDLAPTDQEIKAMAIRSVERIIKQKDPNFEKNIGTLPDSPIYFMKLTKETIIGWLKFGDKKTVYLAKLGQKRMIEAFLMQKNNNFEGREKALKGYIKTLEKLNNKNLELSLKNLIWNSDVLSRMNFIMPEDSVNYPIAIQMTAELNSGQIIKAATGEIK